MCAAEATTQKGVPNVLHWPKPPQALHAAQFGHSFFAILQSTTAIVPEVRFQI